MFRKSNKEPQLDIFGSVASMLPERASQKFNNEDHWHNQFREQVLMRIDETIYKVLFNDNYGAPNSPIRILVGMMILKESFGWSDSQLFERSLYDLLVRSALGLVNINDPLPVESTYYLLRKRIYEYQKQSEEDLMAKTFEQITREQIKEFNVNGRQIRMDSKLIGSNIALCSRYEIIHQSLTIFYKSLNKFAKTRLQSSDRKELENLVKEEPEKTVYRSTREELKGRLQPIGILTYKVLQLFGDLKTDSYQLLQRVFNEQYKVSEDLQIELRPKEEITSSSVQSPHDSESAYKNKNNHPVKGYSYNVAETCSDQELNLITSVIVEKANTPDPEFVEPAIKETITVTEQLVEKAHVDGAYQSPANDEFCEGIDMVFTGIQGYESKYDLDLTPEGLMVTNTETGECQKAVLVKKNKNSKEDRYRITTPKGNYYFSQQAIRASMLRKKMKARPLEELRKRNNVEATIFQLSCYLRNNKSRYRGLFKQRVWAYCRCLWINLVRIINSMKPICQRTFKNMEIFSQLASVCKFCKSYCSVKHNLSYKFTMSMILLIVINYYRFY
jgi:hypothetical protein